MGLNGGIEFQFTQNLEFSGPFCEIWSAKLTIHRESTKKETKTSVNSIVVNSLQYCFDRPAKGQIIDIHRSQLLETSQSQRRIIFYKVMRGKSKSSEQEDHDYALKIPPLKFHSVSKERNFCPKKLEKFAKPKL